MPITDAPVVTSAPTDTSPQRRSARPGASAKVGIVGGGQLARMTHQAAIALGVETYVLVSDLSATAVRAGAGAVIGAPGELDAIRGLAQRTDVLTFDHEHVPSRLIAVLESEGVAVRPGSVAVRSAQDKLFARRSMSAAGLPVPEFAAVSSPGEVNECAERWGWPIVLKARRGGYDGRGVEIVDRDSAEAAIARMGSELVAEPLVAIARELSQILAVAPSGEVASYPLIETVQQDGICVRTAAPAPVPAETAARCGALAREVAAAIGATGILAVELFLTTEGELLINEIAVRPHNSGHLTIEGCETSQFENHLRAILDWPLGDTALVAPAVAMTNVLGAGDDPSSRLPEALSVSRAHPHLYAKEPRPGRKLGHVTALGQTAEEAQEAAARCAAILAGDQR